MGEYILGYDAQRFALRCEITYTQAGCSDECNGCEECDESGEFIPGYDLQRFLRELSGDDCVARCKGCTFCRNQCHSCSLSQQACSCDTEWQSLYALRCEITYRQAVCSEECNGCEECDDLRYWHCYYNGPDSA